MKLWNYLLSVLFLFVILGTTNLYSQTDDENFTSMYYAVQNGDLDALTELVKAHSKLINMKDGELLQGAVGFAANPPIIKLLLDSGAKPNQLDKSGRNPLHIVLDETTADPERLKTIQEIVKLLVDKGTDVNYKRPSDGFSAILLAAKKEDVSKGIMEELLKAKNPDVNAMSTGDAAGITKGWSPLLYACNRNMIEGNTTKEIVEMLLAKGADVKMVTKLADNPAIIGRTALHMIAENTGDRDDIAAVLLEKGAVLDAKDVSSWTPLHVSMWCNTPKIAKLLLTKGADMHIKNSDGTDILSHAKGYGVDKHLESADVIINWAKTH